jgi:hypothetical protein
MSSSRWYDVDIYTGIYLINLEVSVFVPVQSDKIL